MLHLAVSAIREYTLSYDIEKFKEDNKTQDAVVRNLLKLGEAANRLPKEFRDQYREIEWSRIIRTRHILTHEYERVDYDIIWKIITLYLPPLKNILEKILSGN